MATVSIIVPVYKADPWVEQCLASIRAQTYKDIELIVIDDKEGTGAAMARNRGLEKATGEFIAFCDADDYMECNAIEKLVEAIDGMNMAVGSFRKFGAFDMIVQHNNEVMTRDKVAAYVMGNMLDPRSNQMLSGCWAKLYREKLIGKFPLITTAEDMVFNFDYLMRTCHSIRFIQDVVYHNRKRGGSLTTSFDEKDRYGLFGFMEGLEYVERFLDGFYLRDEIRRSLDNSRMYHSILYFKRVCESTGLSMDEAFKRLYP